MKSIGLELAASAGISAVNTSATGTNYVQLTSQSANQVTIVNSTGTTIRARYCSADGTSIASSSEILISTGSNFTLRGIGNCAQVKVKRNDESNTQVSVTYYYEGVAVGPAS